MNAQAWVISDTHFGHENIIRYCGRPFASADKMDEALVRNWNSRVAPGDKVYHLGDVTHGIKTVEGWRRLREQLASLNGRVTLILGNHDDPRSPLLTGWAREICISKNFRLKNRRGIRGVVMSHYPLYLDPAADTGSLNVHGHIHNLAPRSRWHANVSVERTGYYPVPLEMFLDGKRDSLQLDHDYYRPDEGA